MTLITNRSAPTAVVVPVLVYPDAAAAIEWLCRVFGCHESLRYTAPNGTVLHAQLSYRDGAIMLGREGGAFRAPHGNEVSHFIHVAVDDVDEHFERARQSAARIIETPADKPFGERQYTALDPAGHRWTFSQHIANVAPEDWGATKAPSA